MDQIKKKIIQITSVIICIIVIAVLVITTLICIGLYRSRNGEKPWDAYNVVWYSEDPKIEIINYEDLCWDGYLIKDEEKIEVSLSWGFSMTFQICYRGNDCSDEATLIRGELEYNGEYVTLKIETDKVYEYQYKELILYKREYQQNIEAENNRKQ